MNQQKEGGKGGMEGPGGREEERERYGQRGRVKG